MKNNNWTQIRRKISSFEKKFENFIKNLSKQFLNKRLIIQISLFSTVSVFDTSPWPSRNRPISIPL